MSVREKERERKRERKRKIVSERESEGEVSKWSDDKERMLLISSISDICLYINHFFLSSCQRSTDFFGLISLLSIA